MDETRVKYASGILRRHLKSNLKCTISRLKGPILHRYQFSRLDLGAPCHCRHFFLSRAWPLKSRQPSDPIIPNGLLIIKLFLCEAPGCEKLPRKKTRKLRLFLSTGRFLIKHSDFFWLDTEFDMSH